MDSRAALAALRRDLNPRAWGVLWDLRGRWWATTPSGHVIAASSPDELRRRVRRADGTTDADTATLPVCG